MLPGIERRLRQLHSPSIQYFVSVAEAGSFRGAARKLNIASSAINRHVLLLEKELGFGLFERRGRELELTSAGQIILQHCIETVRDFEDVIEQLDALRDLRKGIVRVAVSESFASEIAPEICAEFSAIYPGIRVHVRVSESGKVIDFTSRDECDVGIAFGHTSGTGRELARYKLPIGAVVGARHPLTGRESISIRECFDYPLVIPDKALSIRRLLDEAVDLFRTSPEGNIEATSPRLMLGIARMNRHIVFQSKLGLANDLKNSSLHFIPLTDKNLKPDQAVLMASPRSQNRFAAIEFSTFFAKALERELSGP
ncbi:LysR family transcriptional regulator [Salinihabitans flavidus]|nr:LysR family transcriptional regulator [Salinihabitans flavidus]